jgi:hypothetical protein
LDRTISDTIPAATATAKTAASTNAHHGITRKPETELASRIIFASYRAGGDEVSLACRFRDM